MLKNDSDADGDSLTIKSTTNPSHGSVKVENGKIKYTPNSGFSGKDSFEYTISDGKGGEAKAAVEIMVNKDNEGSKNHTPSAKDDFAKTKYQTKAIIDVLANDSDADGDAIKLDSLSQPKHGKAVIKDSKVEYTPQNGFSGKDSFSYSIKDSKGAVASASVEVEVGKKPNTAPVAKDDSATTEYETPVTIDVLKNDSDADGDSLTIKSTTNPSHGSVKVENGKIKYRPNSGFSGSDRFEYTISDGEGAEDRAKVTVMVKANGDDSNNNEYHFPIIGDGGVESVVKLYTNFTKIDKDDHTEFNLDKNRGKISVYDDGEVEINDSKAPMPSSKLAAGTTLKVDKDALTLQFKMTKDLWFK